MNEEIEPPLKISWVIDGIRYDEPPTWVKKHIADVMCGVATLDDRQKYKDDWGDHTS